ncbi:MAG: hypothetical protein R3185_01530 [Candidatus Thermoplasmatota archaeon]|nr:hypothetical protein [Candidatus Thermoplasmatota archaeon]
MTAALGGTDPAALARARREIHWASQPPSGVGLTLAVPAPDGSHAALTFDPATRRLVSSPGPSEVQASLVVDEALLTLHHGTDGGGTTFQLAGRSFQEARAWLESTLHALVHDGEPLQVRDLSGMPPSPLATGARFRAADQAHIELAAWLTLAEARLSLLAGAHEDAGPVLCWPHHLDIATLRTLVPAREDDEAGGVTIGAGLTLGDASHETPYFYVTPWPYPEDPGDLPTLELGTWHTEGWVGAGLTSEALTTHEATSMPAVLDRFLAGAMAAAEDVHRAQGLL